ncbi:inner membrane CreD family protein, partial [Bacillus pumilus]
GCALCLFFLLLLAMAEKMPFYIAYAIVTVMTVGLIGTFVKGIMAYTKAVVLTAGILIVEYGIILLLLYMGSMALLIGSLS